MPPERKPSNVKDSQQPFPILLLEAEIVRPSLCLVCIECNTSTFEKYDISNSGHPEAWTYVPVLCIAAPCTNMSRRRHNIRRFIITTADLRILIPSPTFPVFAPPSISHFARLISENVRYAWRVRGCDCRVSGSHLLEWKGGREAGRLDISSLPYIRLPSWVEMCG